MRLAPYIINPDNHYKMTWDILIACSYFTCFWLDPFIFGFWYEPLLNVETMRLTYLLTLILLADSFLTPFIGERKKVSPGKDDDDETYAVKTTKPIEEGDEPKTSDRKH